MQDIAIAAAAAAPSAAAAAGTDATASVESLQDIAHRLVDHKDWPV